MKRILIVNNNLDIGGIQKSLVNLLRQVSGEYDITLLLFSRSGALMDGLPENVRVITPKNRYRILGLGRNELKKHPLLFALKAILVQYAAVFSRRGAMRLLGVGQKPLGGYDAAISYSHLPHSRQFANGCGDFVLDKVRADKKICFVHCDYSRAGNKSCQNNARYAEFDTVACCSESVRQVFVSESGLDENKVCTVYNFFDQTLPKQAEKAPCHMDDGYINLVTVARLSPEKGIDTAISALKDSGRQDIKYCVVGDGPQLHSLKRLAEACALDGRVVFAGETQNPYGLIKAADYLLVPSRHEAAPMVFMEASALGVPVISSDTLSARELLKGEDIIYSDAYELENILGTLEKRAKGTPTVPDNKLQAAQFEALLKK